MGNPKIPLSVPKWRYAAEIGFQLRCQDSHFLTGCTGKLSSSFKTTRRSATTSGPVTAEVMSSITAAVIALVGTLVHKSAGLFGRAHRMGLILWLIGRKASDNIALTTSSEASVSLEYDKCCCTNMFRSSYKTSQTRGVRSGNWLQTGRELRSAGWKLCANLLGTKKSSPVRMILHGGILKLGFHVPLEKMGAAATKCRYRTNWLLIKLLETGVAV